MSLQPNQQPGPPFAPDLPQLGVGILQAMPAPPGPLPAAFDNPPAMVARVKAPLAVIDTTVFTPPMGAGVRGSTVVPQDVPMPRRVATKPAPETTFPGTTLGWAPTKFQTWAVDPQPRPFRPRPPPEPSFHAFGQLGCLPVQIESTTGQIGGSATSVTAIFNQAQVLGNTNIVAVVWNDSNVLPSNGLTDSAGNAYTMLFQFNVSGTCSIAVFKCVGIKAASGGSNTLTVSWGSTAVLDPFVEGDQFTPSDVDAETIWFAGSASSFGSVAGNPVQSAYTNEYRIGWLNPPSSTVHPAGGWTTDPATLFNIQQFVSVPAIAGSSWLYAATLSPAGPWVAASFGLYCTGEGQTLLPQASEPAPRRLLPPPAIFDSAPLDAATTTPTVAEFLQGQDLFVPARAAGRVESAVPLDAAMGAGIGAFSPWAYDPAPKRVATSPVPDTPLPGTTLGWAPTSWVQWTNEPPWSVKRQLVESATPLDALMGGGLSPFAPWTFDPPPRPVPVAREVETPYTGDSIGWAPEPFQQWAHDPARPWRPSLRAEVTYVADDALGVFLTPWVQWSADPQPRPFAPKPAPETTFPGTSLGWAPTSWVPWSVDPSPVKIPTPRADAVGPVDALVVVGTTLAPVWSVDPSPRRVVTQPAVETTFPGTSLGWAPTSWAQWTNEPSRWRPPPLPLPELYPLDAVITNIIREFFPNNDLQPKRVVTTPALETTFPGTTLGWAPTSWVLWSDAPAPPWKPSLRAESAQVLDDAMGTTSTPWVQWSVEPPPRWRPPSPPLAELYPLDDVATNIIREFFPNNDPQPKRVVTTPALETTFPGTSLGWALTSWVPWVQDPARQWRENPRAETAQPTGPAMGVFPTSWVQWASEPLIARARVVAVPEMFPLDAIVPPIAKFIVWTPDSPTRPPTRRAAQEVAPLDALPVPVLRDFLHSQDPTRPPAFVQARPVDAFFFGAFILPPPAFPGATSAPVVVVEPTGQAVANVEPRALPYQQGTAPSFAQHASAAPRAAPVVTFGQPSGGAQPSGSPSGAKVPSGGPSSKPVK